MPQRLAAHAVHRLQHQRRHRRLDAVEQARHPGHLAVHHIDPAQADQDQQRGQHEQHAGHHPTPAAVQQPADVGGELLRLRPGQQHAVVERVQEPLLADPALFLHQLAVHDGDLPRRPAKTDETQLEPETQGLPKIHGARGVHAGLQLWVSALPPS